MDPDGEELEVVPQRKLGNSWSSGTRDLAKRRGAQGIIRLVKIGPVDQIEKVCPERKSSRLVREGNESLHNREVVLQNPRTRNAIPPCGAELPWRGVCKCSSIEVFEFLGAARATAREVGIADNIRSFLPGVGTTVTDQSIVLAAENGFRRAGVITEDTSKPPTSRHRIQDSVAANAWDIPQSIHSENLGHIEIRGTPFGRDIEWILRPGPEQ